MKSFYFQHLTHIQALYILCKMLIFLQLYYDGTSVIFVKFLQYSTGKFSVLYHNNMLKAILHVLSGPNIKDIVPYSSQKKYANNNCIDNRKTNGKFLSAVEFLSHYAQIDDGLNSGLIQILGVFAQTLAARFHTYM